MISKKFNVPLYGFRVDFIECEDEKDGDAIETFFKRLKMEDDIANEIVGAVRQGDVDGGWTLACLGIKRIVVILLPMRTRDRRCEVINHEKRHVEDDILRHCNVNDDEAAAYLSGFLGKFLR